MPATERLYYTDSELRSFDARVIACDIAAGRYEVILDRSAFYPTSGGQPFDTGRLGDVKVLDVRDEDDGRVVHVVDASIAAGTSVRGEIDWPRRLDHMQQHTGQHMLSAAFDRLFDVSTVSFHLGAESSTIDLARDVTPSEVSAAENEANRVVWEDRAIGVRFATEEEARALSLRKESVRTGTLRLVEIPDFDLSACGGTHVARTGGVGMIAVTGAERFKGATRLTFACGSRALRSHRALRDVVAAATRTLSTTPAEIPATLERMQSEARENAKALRRLQDLVSGYRGVELRAAAVAVGRHLAVLRSEPDLDAGGLKGLAVAVVADSAAVVVLVGRGTPAPVIVARGADADVDAASILKELASTFGGRGGGNSEIAQGGIPAAPDQVLERVRILLSR